MHMIRWLAVTALLGVSVAAHDVQAKVGDRGPTLGSSEADFIGVWGKPDVNSNPHTTDRWKPCPSVDADQVVVGFAFKVAVSYVFARCDNTNATVAQMQGVLKEIAPSDSKPRGVSQDKTYGRLHLYYSAWIGKNMPAVLAHNKAIWKDCGGIAVPVGTYAVATQGGVGMVIGGCINH